MPKRSTGFCSVQVVPAPSPTIDSLRGATGYVFMYNFDREATFTSASAPSTYFGLASVKSKLSKCCYAPPGQMTTSSGWTDVPAGHNTFKYDHSATGIENGAQKLARWCRGWHHYRGVRRCIFDIETFYSTNVPASVNYVQANDTFFANTWEWGTTAHALQLKNEVNRFRTLLVPRARDLIRTVSGTVQLVDVTQASKPTVTITNYVPYNGYELSDYNCPRKFNNNQRNYTNTTPEMVESAQILGSYVAFLDGCGPQAQMLPGATEGAALPGTYTPGGGSPAWDSVIEWFANGVRRTIQVYPESRPTVTIWPVLNVNNPNLPTRIVPAGVMTELLDRLATYNCRRFYLYDGREGTTQGSSAGQTDGTNAQWNARWSEVGTWINNKQQSVQVIT